MNTRDITRYCLAMRERRRRGWRGHRAGAIPQGELPGEGWGSDGARQRRRFAAPA